MRIQLILCWVISLHVHTFIENLLMKTKYFLGRKIDYSFLLWVLFVLAVISYKEFFDMKYHDLLSSFLFIKLWRLSFEVLT